jgi:single-strand DNA-binding protein
MNLNRVLIAGNLTRDPQTKFLSGDRAVANFGLAINRKFKGSDGEQKEEATFVEVEAWGRTAELAGQYLAKGRPCFIEGRLKLDQFEDKEGKKQSRLKVVAESIQFIGGKRDGDQAQAQEQRAQAATTREQAPDVEPPF